MDSSYILPIGIFCTFVQSLLDLEANIYKLTLVCTSIFFYKYLKQFFFKDCTVFSPHDEQRSSYPRPVKFCSDQSIFSFYLELQNVYKNKFKNLIRPSKFDSAQ